MRVELDKAIARRQAQVDARKAAKLRYDAAIAERDAAEREYRKHFPWRGDGTRAAEPALSRLLEIKAAPREKRVTYRDRTWLNGRRQPAVLDGAIESMTKARVKVITETKTLTFSRHTTTRHKVGDCVDSGEFQELLPSDNWSIK